MRFFQNEATASNSIVTSSRFHENTTEIVFLKQPQQQQPQQQQNAMLCAYLSRVYQTGSKG